MVHVETLLKKIKACQLLKYTVQIYKTKYFKKQVEVTSKSFNEIK